MMKKIVILGPESTGKTTLCQQLAAHYTTTWIAEYAREYLLKNGATYTYENLLDIAKGQIANEELGIRNWETPNHKLQTTNYKPVFIDTDMHVMQVWCEFVFERCHHWILNRIAERKYDLFLLCDIDLPWVKDELREYPDLVRRQKLYHHYKEIMLNQHVPWIEISGNYEARLEKAIKAVDKLQ